MPANTTPRTLWAAYQRLVARETIASREADAAYAAWDAATRKRAELAAEARAAHEAYLKALKDAALICAAEAIAFNIPHLFTGEH
jgi:hypothetical protein